MYLTIGIWYMFLIIFLIRNFWTFKQREKYRKILFDYAISKNIDPKRFTEMLISSDCVESYISTVLKFWRWKYERFIKDEECLQVWNSKKT